MEHSFDIKVAAEVGVNAAVIFRNICHWLQLNEKNHVNFNDGKYWVFNTNTALQAIFPYLTKNQISTAIGKLKDEGYIITGNYNKIPFDRTLWFALGDKGNAFWKKETCISEKSEMDVGKIGNQISEKSDTNTSYRKDIETDNIPPISPQGGNAAPAADINKIISELKRRVNMLFHRRDTTTWTEKETAKLRQIAKRNGVLDECAEIERLYNSGYEYRRRDIGTFLNNWTVELDRARNPISGGSNPPVNPRHIGNPVWGANERGRQPQPFDDDYEER